MFVDTAQRPASVSPASTKRPAGASRAPRTRSRATNILGYLPRVHPLSAEGRRYVDVTRDLADRFGGEDKLDGETVALIREIGSLVVKVEAMQSKLVLDEPIDDEMFVRYSNMLSRKREELRLLAERKAQAKPLTLAELAAHE